MSWRRRVVHLLLFMAEQIPESLVLAFSFVSGFVDVSLAVFLFCVQFCSFSGAVLDHMMEKPPKQLYFIWSQLFSFALGAVVANFGTILDHFEVEGRSAASVGMLVLGLAIGVVIFSLISVAESKLEAHLPRPDFLPSLKRMLALGRQQLYSVQTAESAEDAHRQSVRNDSLRNLISSLEHARGLKKELSV
jgi:hypothetical protein